MPTATVHYDGWLKLPEQIRKALGVKTDDMLELTIEGSVVTLRKAGTRRKPTGEAEASAELAVAADEASAEPDAARKGAGRGVEGAEVRKARGRRKAKSSAEDLDT
jgi:bifunctional DNA-binding transcriptional regulator/antitoxin component of YhaV-PrlF toxin-antitoxin module